ncbi:MAG: VCBS repeat-containing protein [Verrucomicrobia bacterium]|nr:VCBS repeat-containing protein [Verrucomicrobiota bacterium]
MAIGCWLLAIGSGATHAADKSGVGLNKISLPSGPGSIEGLGDSFEPQLNSGTSAYSVKVAIPPGVNGLQPEVVLRYNAGSGNGPFGLAWGYEPMTIQRQTHKGLPAYGPGDVFTFQGEELVPLTDGSYRQKIESSFLRFTRAGDGWEVRDKSGRLYRVGAVSRVIRTGGTRFQDTFKWYVDEVLDTHGNRMEYRYSTHADSPGQLYLSEIRYSISRSDAAIFHAVSFEYEPRPDAFSSFVSGFEIRTARRCREIRVLSRNQLVRRYTLSYANDPADPIEPVAPGDAGLDFSQLRRVTQFDNQDGPSASFLPPLQFGYTRFDASAGTAGVLVNTPSLSLGNPNLAFADLNCDSLPDLLYTDPLTGAHVVYYNLGEGIFADGVHFVGYPGGVTLDVPETELADFDGDGRVDLIQKAGAGFGRFVFYPNTTQPVGNDDHTPSWGPEQEFGLPHPPFTLDDPTVRTLDLNNDKRIDFFRATPLGFIYYYNRTNRWEEDGLYFFGEPQLGDISAADGISFSKTDHNGAEVPNDLVKLADMNGDRLLDLVKLTVFATRLELIFWPNQGRGAWGNRQIMQGTVELGVIPIEDAFIQDINADGLADVVAVGYDYIKYWVNQGNGSFSAVFLRIGMPFYDKGRTVLRLVDINGNGSTDFLWENWLPTTGDFRVEFYDFLGAAKPNLLQTIDNGIGLRTHIEYQTTTDYYVAARMAGNPWLTSLPFPSQVVSRITREIGLDLDAVPGNDRYVTEFAYFNGHYDTFEKEFRGFAFAKKVEWGDDNPALNPQPSTLNSPSTVTRFAFHTGAPDGLDNNDDGRADEFDELTGYEEEPLKGRVLWTEATLLTADLGGPFPAQTDGQPASDAVVFTRDINDWRIKTIHTATNGFEYRDAFNTPQPALSFTFGSSDGKRVSFAYLASQTKEIHDANGALAGTDAFTPARSSKQLYSETDVDFFGNTIIERTFGENSAGSTFDDERFTFSTYAFNFDAWLIGLPARTLVTDEHGAFVSDTRHFYDGADFVGLPLGQVGTYGNMMREEKFINGPTAAPAFSFITNLVGDPRLPVNASINSVRSRYDTFGNLVETLDPLHVSPITGHAREYAYDPVFHTYVERETIRVGNGSANLVATAGYDYGAGVMTAATNFNAHATTFQYDSFWRLVGVVKPGDSAALPTVTYAYRPGDPFRHLYYQYTPSGDLTLRPAADTDIANAVTTRQREQAGTANTFDTTSFTDGAGHKLGTLEESDTPGQWIARDFKRYSSQGEERQAFLPFVTSSPAYQVPTETTYHVASFYDAASRVIRTVNPPETTNVGARVTETRTVHLPLETMLFDEEDADPVSPRFGTAHVQLKDGLDRLIAVKELVKLSDDGTPSGQLNEWLTRYAYDLNDNLTGIRDSQNNQKWFRYDGLKRKLFMNDPDRGEMTYTYDAASNLRSTLDAKQQFITYAYDGVNRLLTEDYQDGRSLPPWRLPSTLNPQPSTHSVSYHYDTPFPNLPVGDNTTATANNTKGMLAWVEDLSGEEHTSYDSRGRVESVIKRIPDPLFFSLSASGGEGRGEVDLVSYRTGYAYDSLDRLTTLTYPDNDQVSQTYNARNLLRQITGGPSGNIISNILYRPSGQLQQIDYGNAVRTTYAYDPRLRLRNLHTLSAFGGEGRGEVDLIHFLYEFDGASNIRTITDTRPASQVPANDPRRNTQGFTYDDLYRLTSVTYNAPNPSSVNGGSIHYRYDRIGNMLAQTSDIVHDEKGLPIANLGDMDSGGASGRAGRIGRDPGDAPGPHALTSIRHSSFVIRHFPYDSNGNMAVIDGLTNTWDFKDHLIAVENAEMRAEYTYDYTDRRIIKRVFPKQPLFPTGGEGQGEGATAVLYPDKYFEVRDHDTPVKYVWNGNTRVARVTGSLNTNQRVQRLRLWPGPNLVSLVVSGSLSAFGREGQGEVVSSAAKWDPATLTWLPVATNETLAAGTVLWLNAATNATLAITGNYTEPTNASIPAGVSFLPVPGFDSLALSNALPANAAAWKYDAGNRYWQARLTGDLQSRSDLPSVLLPGEALFVRADAATQLTIPDSALRIRYYHQDHLGSSDSMSANNGSVLQEAAHYPFGESRHIVVTMAAPDAYDFAQKETDVETRFAYFEARFSARSLARFLTVDALSERLPSYILSRPQHLNVYSYAGNSPIVYVDPEGLEPRKGFFALANTTDPSKLPFSDYIDQGAEFLFEKSAELKAGPLAFVISPVYTPDMKRDLFLGGVLMEVYNELIVKGTESAFRQGIYGKNDTDRLKGVGNLALIGFGGRFFTLSEKLSYVSRFPSVRALESRGLPLGKEYWSRVMFFMKGNQANVSSTYRAIDPLLKGFKHYEVFHLMHGAIEAVMGSHEKTGGGQQSQSRKD